MSLRATTLRHGQHAARESRVERDLLREYEYGKFNFREYLMLGLRRRSGVRCTLQMLLHRGKSLLYEQRHFTNVFTGPVARSDFIWWGLLGEKKSIEFKPLQRYLPIAMEYEVNNREVNCNFPYLIDFLIFI
jgi:hypothetical protein